MDITDDIEGKVIIYSKEVYKKIEENKDLLEKVKDAVENPCEFIDKLYNSGLLKDINNRVKTDKSKDSIDGSIDGIVILHGMYGCGKLDYNNFKKLIDITRRLGPSSQGISGFGDKGASESKEGKLEEKDYN